MRSSSTVDVIVFTDREEVKKPAGEHLRMKGVSNILCPQDADEAIDALNRHPKSLLIIDWELGPKCVARVLGYNRQKFVHENRPILLIASMVDDAIVTTAAEYHVTQIYTEALTVKNLGARLTNLIIGESSPSDVKKVLAQVAEARAGGNHKEAFNALSKALQKHPTHLRLKCEAAETLMTLGEWDKAHQLLAGLDSTKPPYLRAVHLLGRCLMKMGQFETAVEMLEKASLFNQHDVERLVDIGNALLHADRGDDAEKKFEAALGVDPNYRPAKVGKGQAKLLDGQVNDALSILREVSGEVEMASMFNVAAILNARRGRHEAGMNLYTAALKSLGKDERLQSRLHFNMGLGYRRWGKPEKAVTAFETAVKLDPSFEKAKTSLAATKSGSKAPAKKPPPSVAAAAKKAKATDIPVAGAGLVDFESLDSPLDEDLLEESLYDTTKII